MFDSKSVWIKDISENWFTPGGDPVFVCKACGGGKHVYGIEHNHPLEECPDCHRKMEYEYKKERR